MKTMNKLKVFKIAPGFIALPFLLSLSACGKNMHVVFSKPAPVAKDATQKDAPPKEATKTPEAPVPVVVIPPKTVPVAVVGPEKPVVVAPVLPVRPSGTVTDSLPISPAHELPVNSPSQVILPPYVLNPIPAVNCPITAGLGNISKFDADLNNLPPLPFKNIESGKAYYNLMGSPQAILGPDSKKPDAGYIKNSNELFRSVFHLSKPDTIRSIPVFKLKLTGLRRYRVKSPASDLSGQVLCILDTKICSGEKPLSPEYNESNLNPAFWDGAKIVTPVFSKTKLDDLLNTDAIIKTDAINGATVATTSANDSLGLKQGDAIYDMRELFGLQDLTTSELIQWILDNSTEFAEPGFRKFRFVIGNNTYAESGEIQIQEIMNTDVDPDLKTPPDLNKLVNGHTDIEQAVQPVTGTVVNSLPQQNVLSEVTSQTKPSGWTEVINADPIPTPRPDPMLNEVPVIDTHTPVKSDKPVETQIPSIPVNIATPTPSPTPAPVVVVPQPEVPVELKMFSDQLGFRYNIVEITEGSGKDKLIEAAKYLGEIQAVSLISSITVMSQTDISGNYNRNRMLSEQRAENVIALLKANGLAKVLIIADPKGQVAVSSCGSIRKCDQDRFVKITIEFDRNLTDAVRNELKAVVNAKLEEIRTRSADVRK